jgi:hypothetical protein
LGCLREGFVGLRAYLLLAGYRGIYVAVKAVPAVLFVEVSIISEIASSTLSVIC